MEPNFEIQAHEDGWAILRNQVLQGVYPSYHMAASSLPQKARKHQKGRSGSLGYFPQKPIAVIPPHLVEVPLRDKEELILPIGVDGHVLSDSS
ncbi:hypothetical protein [Rhizobium sp. RM]|uniref:hypothetical protein n=1 Tax=Rhizobium sp. RM TaxID=2748079 RepID=UPI00110EE26D|nr:hypothetical protein [Rhizobium sp. RM]NWJ27518.1 hypothetical protein [Rhizobium sp. RM]TMV20019.1 hypothetical protein BJG94_11555 [Rhizobium sp. Td3]